MRKSQLILGIFLAMTMTGCAALTSAGLTRSALDIVKEDLTETRNDRALRKAYVAVVMADCQMAARDASSWTDKKAIHQECLDILEENEHMILLERLPARLARIKAAQTAIEEAVDENTE